MYSRLYTQVLNNFHWSESAQSFNVGYKSGGLFGIHGACTPGNAYKMLATFYGQLSMIGEGTEGELERAKNQLKSSIMMGLETRLVQVEDIARQLDAYSDGSNKENTENCHSAATEIIGAEEVCYRIDKVTSEQLKQVSRCILDDAVLPTVVSNT